MRSLLILIGLIVLVAITGFLVWAVTQDNETDSLQDERQQGQETDTMQEEGLFGDPQTWETYQSEPLVNDFAFTLRHPEEVSADRETPQIVSFDYIGPDSVQDSEITDGFTFTVRMVEVAADTDVETHAQTLREEIAQQGGGQVSEGEVMERTFDGRPARQWEQASVLGNVVTHLVVALGEETVAEVSYSIAGDREGEYEDTIEEMLETVRFEQQQE